MASQTGKQTIAMHTFSNISKGKGNQGRYDIWSVNRI